MNGASRVICRAWEENSPELIRGILADEFEWFESPFEKPITDGDQLISLWKQHLGMQSEVQVSYEVLNEDNLYQIAKCEARVTRNNERQHLSGVFIIQFNNEGKIKEFRHWWEVDL